MHSNYQNHTHNQPLALVSFLFDYHEFLDFFMYSLLLIDVMLGKCFSLCKLEKLEY
jgi:hypothetical protein